MNIQTMTQQPLMKAYSSMVLVLALVVSVLVTGLKWNESQSYKPHINSTPNTMPDLLFTTKTDLLPGRLYFEMSSFQDNTGYLIEMDHQTGAITFSQQLEAFGMQFQRLDNETMTFYEITEANAKGLREFEEWAGIPFATGGHMALLNNEYQRIGSLIDPRGIDIHEIVKLDNGNLLYLIPDLRSPYSDPTLTCLPRCQVLGQSIVEVTPDGEVVFEWDALDYYERSDFVLDDILILGHTMLYDVTHANALEVTPDGNLLISIRHTSEIIKIDRETGAILWRLGGAESHHNDFQYINDPFNGVSHQHQPVMLDNGNLLIFDNGNGRERPYTRVVEYQLDEASMTATLVWSYVTPEQHFSPNRGNAQRLENGNTLINYVSRDKPIVEVNPEGEIVMEIDLPDGYESYASYQVQFWPE